MKVRLRDFVETEIGYFAVNTYEHPKDRVFAFLRYLNLDAVDDDIITKYNLNRNDIRRQMNGNKYIKITDTTKTYNILKDYFPEYLFYDETKDIVLHAVPRECITNILSPNDRLKEILNEQNNEFEKKCKDLADELHAYGLNYKYMGVSGSTVIKLNNEGSDIDFVIYGMKNHKKARGVLKTIFNKKKDNIHPLSNDFWKKAYNKRIKDGTLSYDEFVWHEKRKYNRGVINNTMFDLLATRDWNEINSKYGDYSYKNLGFIKIECDIINDDYIFDNPAIYKINNVKIINLKEKYKLKLKPEDIKEIVSFTHTYAGQAFNGERVIARGKLEGVSSPYGDYKRIVVGTSREAFNEYIKLI
ncbi:nucleotidyltransferase domain-containing protein [Methanothermococcus sp.]|uniref:nucleotidyltransferase domain-containing protein n=1 Tax=Methanothermococcus sp. TaxID=2614238 RepID=UPI0025EAE79C|nr:nucleotidyltransferase domain-containing protein [Methanothermococcus sp.]